MDWNVTRRALVRIIPTCFVLGACMEYFMIKVPIGGQTFYDVAKRKKAERLLEEISEQNRVIEEREERRRRLREKYGDQIFQEED